MGNLWAHIITASVWRNFPDRSIQLAEHSGLAPTDFTGKITKIKSRFHYFPFLIWPHCTMREWVRPDWYWFKWMKNPNIGCRVVCAWIQHDCARFALSTLAPDISGLHRPTTDRNPTRLEPDAPQTHDPSIYSHPSPPPSIHGCCGP